MVGPSRDRVCQRHVHPQAFDASGNSTELTRGDSSDTFMPAMQTAFAHALSQSLKLDLENDYRLPLTGDVPVQTRTATTPPFRAATTASTSPQRP